ncbi:MAG TPA: uracil-DNA glycosylase [Candidatus Sulfotelmatobacter sp.]|nr:uracil-DNA glycosylase [Candidatus Sulfotelmatobacter sp.]
MSIAERTRRQVEIDRLTAVVAACRKCAIGATRRNSVFGEGDPCAALMVVGEGPGETEDKLGRPFVGRAGELLDKMLLAIGLPREDVFICNTVKCRPTIDVGHRLANRAPTPDEMRNCRPFLDEQIALIRPRVILALGAPAAKSFLGERFSISRQRGQWHEGPLGIPIIATFHPAYVLRQTGGSMNEVKRLVWNDLKQVRDRIARAADGGPEPPAVQDSLFD